MHLGSDDMRADDVLFRQKLKQRTHEHGLAGTDIAGNDDESLALSNAVAQIGKRALVPAAAEKKARVRAQAEWLGLEVVESLVHLKMSCSPAG